jgi:hypothetical protein
MFHKDGPLRIVFLEIQDVINKFLVSSSLSIVLFGFMKNLALHLGRSPFHLRLAFLPDWLIQGCSSGSNPFIGVKIHRIFPFLRFTHSYGYELAGDHPTYLAKFPINSKSFIKHPGGTPHV